MALYTICALAPDMTRIPWISSYVTIVSDHDPAIAMCAVFIYPTCSHTRPTICNLNRHQVSSSYSRLDFVIFTHIKYTHVSIITAISMTPGTSAVFRVSVKRHAKYHIFSIITLATVYRFKESRTVMANDCEKEKYKLQCSFGYAAGIANACQKF